MFYVYSYEKKNGEEPRVFEKMYELRPGTNPKPLFETCPHPEAFKATPLSECPKSPKKSVTQSEIPIPKIPDSINEDKLPENKLVFPKRPSSETRLRPPRFQTPMMNDYDDLYSQNKMLRKELREMRNQLNEIYDFIHGL